MAGEIIIHARLDPRKTMAEIVSEKVPDEDLAQYTYGVEFDRDRIRMPSFDSGSSADSDPQDIHRIIEARWSGEAGTIDELEMIMLPFVVYAYIPIVITMYPGIEVDRAIRGEDVKMDPKAIIGQRPEISEEVKRAIDEIMAMHDIFSDLETKSRAGASRSRKFDVIMRIGNHEIRFTQTGRWRKPDGTLGPSPVDRKGKFSFTVDDPIRPRSDGHVWMRVKSKNRTKWIRLTARQRKKKS